MSGTATRSATITPAMTAYLLSVRRLNERGDAALTGEVAEEVGVAEPSATNMIKRLHALGLLRYTRYHGATLTRTGEQIACEVTRRHDLLERFLSEVLGLQPDQASSEANRLGPHISAAFEARLEAVLGASTLAERR